MKKFLVFLSLFCAFSFAQDWGKIGNIFKGMSRDFTEEEEKEIGKEIAAKLLGIYKLYKDDDLTRYINLVGNYVALYSDQPKREYIFAVLDTDTINAYSCPGGYIFVTKGLLGVVSSEAELAVILSHEIAHITEKHILKEIKRANILSDGTEILADRAVGGKGIGKDLAKKLSQKAMETLLTKGLAKKDEYEADSKGFEFACRAGYNSKVYEDFLKKLDSLTKSPGMAVLVKTHPTPENRLKELKGKNCTSQIVLTERYKERIK
ncbi:MAG: M48 family metalloprotease [Thermoanaerobaculia bacterium]